MVIPSLTISRSVSEKAIFSEAVQERRIKLEVQTEEQQSIKVEDSELKHGSERMCSTA